MKEDEHTYQCGGGTQRLAAAVGLGGRTRKDDKAGETQSAGPPVRQEELDPTKPAVQATQTSSDFRTHRFRLRQRRKNDEIVHVAPSRQDHGALPLDCSRWMSRLPDFAKLDELYIPGTHESLALHFSLLGSICQDTSLTAQLRGGIRFLDLRFSLLRDRPLRFARKTRAAEGEWEMWAHHGPITQLRRAEKVFEEVYAWLASEEGRGETVIVSCKQENAASSSLFASTLWKLLDTRRALWFDEERWPSLGEVRGKCVMFCRFGFESGRGLHPPSWPNDSPAPWQTEIGGREVVVQDWYGLPSLLAIPQKACLALSLFNPPTPAFVSSNRPSQSIGTTGGGNEGPIPSCLNFLSSASLPLAPPSLCAKGFGWPRLRLGMRGVNQHFLSGLQRLQSTQRRETKGTRYEEGQGGMFVMLDFWQEPKALVPCVIGLNFG